MADALARPVHSAHPEVRTSTLRKLSRTQVCTPRGPTALPSSTVLTMPSCMPPCRREAWQIPQSPTLFSCLPCHWVETRLVCKHQSQASPLHLHSHARQPCAGHPSHDIWPSWSGTLGRVCEMLLPQTACHHCVFADCKLPVIIHCSLTMPACLQPSYNHVPWMPRWTVE